jgi:hypothetical protein
MNTDKLDETLVQYLRNPDTSQTEEIPIIITIDRVTKDLGFLEERGFHVKYHYQNINAVAGTANAKSIASLSALHTVSKIEYDGKVVHFPGK